jgi:hypothetical protein
MARGLCRDAPAVRPCGVGGVDLQQTAETVALLQHQLLHESRQRK